MKTAMPAPGPTATPQTLKHRGRVLGVDDDPGICDMLERALGATHQVVVVRSGGDALAALQYSEPFDVVISDFEMPGMDGVSLFVQVARFDPLATRLMISGHADLDDAAKAINEGRIFSFLRKPFTVPALRMAVDRAVEHHRLLTAERDLLKDTLHGAVNALSGLLALSCPSAYGRGVRLQRHAADLAAAVQAHDRWAIEMAALLQPLALVTLPDSIVQRLLAGLQLDPSEQSQVDRLPDIVDGLLMKIPRLEGLRDTLKYATCRYDGLGSREGPRGREIPQGARILNIVSAFDGYECRGMESHEAIKAMLREPGAYDPEFLKAFAETTSYLGAGLEAIDLLLCDVKGGMVFAENVSMPNGVMLVARGQDVTPSLLARIHGPWEEFAKGHMVRMVAAAEA
jgi:response regulator RpfG family c-di-GMP phosphodiesterase